MTNELDRRALMLCDVALACPPEDRAALLDEQCASDPALREAVDAMLALQSAADGFLVPPERSMPISQHVATVQAGDRIGPFEIKCSLGGGGMGEVYMAEQERPVRRRVALKIIKLGMDTKQVIARFDAERQALALMDHPNIAKVLDAGATDTGRPYFVMELVEGIAITEYCDKQGMSLRDRLKLFVQVCTAVQHAHQKGIIHRDIKPSNVLVTHVDDKPTIKVIDFGIAKATEQRRNEPTLFTEMGQFIGTPAYMSPEQAEPIGLDIDTRSDIFSMGVLLYELLTGVPPFDVKTLRGAALEEIKRIIREDEPSKPSTRLSQMGDALDTVARQRSSKPQKLGSLLRGDLDWIIMKALEKDRTRRYETASGFAKDIDHYLKDEPVDAGPPSGAYRLRKFVRRNRFKAATLGLGVLFLMGSMIALYFVNRQERRLRADAEDAQRESARQAEIANSVVNFLTKDVIETIDPYLRDSNDLTARAMFDQAAERIDSRVFQDKPLVEAKIRLTLGAVYRSLGDTQSAATQLAKALTLYSAELGEEHEETLKVQQHLAWTLSETGKLDEAEALLRRTGDTQQRVLGQDHGATLSTRNDLADVLSRLGRAEEAEVLFKDLIDRYVAKDGLENESTLNAISNYATLVKMGGNLEEAEALFRQVLEVQRKVMGTMHPDTLTTLMNVAEVLYLQDRYEEAEPLARRALAGQQEMLGEGHPVTLLTSFVLGKILYKRNELAEAMKILARARDSSRESKSRSRLQVLDLLCRVLFGLGKLEEARENMEESLALEYVLHGEKTDFSIWLMANLGVVCHRLGSMEDARDYGSRALALSRELYGSEHATTLSMLSGMATICMQDEPEKAESLLVEVLRVHQILQPDQRELAMSYKHKLAMTLQRQQKLDEAEKIYREVVEFREASQATPGQTTLSTLDALASLLEEQERYDEAETMFREIIKMADEVWPDGHFLTANYRRGLADCLTGLKRYAEAEEQLLKSHEQLEKSFPPEHRNRQDHVKDMIKFYEAWGKPDNAAEWQSKLVEPELVAP